MVSRIVAAGVPGNGYAPFPTLLFLAFWVTSAVAISRVPSNEDPAVGLSGSRSAKLLPYTSLALSSPDETLPPTRTRRLLLRALVSEDAG